MPLEHAENLALAIDPNESDPVYQQISDQIYCIIVAMQLENGICLPPIRRLAQQLGVNPATVEKAYRELVAIGVVRSRRGSGFSVLQQTPSSVTERLKILDRRIDSLVLTARRLEISPQALLDEIRRRIDPKREAGKARGPSQTGGARKRVREPTEQPHPAALWFSEPGVVD